jgi:hypothetical protein
MRHIPAQNFHKIAFQSNRMLCTPQNIYSCNIYTIYSRKTLVKLAQAPKYVYQISESVQNFVKMRSNLQEVKCMMSRQTRFVYCSFSFFFFFSFRANWAKSNLHWVTHLHSTLHLARGQIMASQEQRKCITQKLRKQTWYILFSEGFSCVSFTSFRRVYMRLSLGPYNCLGYQQSKISLVNTNFRCHRIHNFVYIPLLCLIVFYFCLN